MGRSSPHVESPLNSEFSTATNNELSLLPEDSEARAAWGRSNYSPQPESDKPSAYPEVSKEPSNRPRVVKRGMLQYPGVGTFWIQAESFPLWLLALDRSFVRAIHLMGGTDTKSFLQAMLARGCDLSLINLVIGRIGLGKVHYSNSP
jgi:hypothetical protein